MVRLTDLLRSFVPTDTEMVSEAWLRSQRRRESRVEFHGISWRWPVRKRENEAAHWNRSRLRQSA